MATIIGIIENFVKYDNERYGENQNYEIRNFLNYEWNSSEYNKYVSSEKSVMTDEDAANYLAKVKEYLELKNNSWDLQEFDELNLKYQLLLSARKGYREKLVSEKAENIEEKVMQRYPFEEIFSYNYFRD